MYCRDLKQLADQVGNPELPEQVEVEHHALADARWNRRVYSFLHGQWQSRISGALQDEAGYLPPRDHINAVNHVLKELGWP